jgi:hypothetical protein
MDVESVSGTQQDSQMRIRSVVLLCIERVPRVLCTGKGTRKEGELSISETGLVQ